MFEVSPLLYQIGREQLIKQPISSRQVMVEHWIVESKKRTTCANRLLGKLVGTHFSKTQFRRWRHNGWRLSSGETSQWGEQNNSDYAER